MTAVVRKVRQSRWAASESTRPAETMPWLTAAIVDSPAVLRISSRDTNGVTQR